MGCCKMSKELISAIENGDASSINEVFESVINSKVDVLFNEFKALIANDMLEDIDDEEEVDEARVKRVNRIRGGVVQRRKVVATDDKYRTKGDGSQSVVRMSASERRNRKIAQKKAARKRKAKGSRSVIKRKLTNRKRQSRGFNK
jgi:phage terminase small subunit